MDRVGEVWIWMNWMDTNKSKGTKYIVTDRIDESGSVTFTLKCLNDPLILNSFSYELRDFFGNKNRWTGPFLPCPKCDEEFQATNDYLCQGCRYGG